MEAAIIALILKYKYLIIFPIAILEGPLLAILCGFLMTMGYLNPFLTFTLLVLGDAVGDSLCYWLGWFGDKLLIRKWGHYIGITEKRLMKAEQYIKTNRKKTVYIGKFAHGFGFTLLIASGMLKFPYPIFVLLGLLGSIFQMIILVLIGVFFGHAYHVLASYLNYFAAITIVVGFVLIAFFGLKHYLNKGKMAE